NPLNSSSGARPRRCPHRRGLRRQPRFVFPVRQSTRCSILPDLIDPVPILLVVIRPRPRPSQARRVEHDAIDRTVRWLPVAQCAQPPEEFKIEVESLLRGPVTKPPALQNLSEPGREAV